MENVEVRYYLEFIVQIDFFIVIVTVNVIMKPKP